MPFYTYTNLGLGILSHTRLTIELADRTIKQPRGIAENVLVMIGKFIFPINFIILDIPEDDDVPLILGPPFLLTDHSKIDVFKRKITLRAGEEKLVFKSVKPATSIIKRVFVMKSLDSKTKFIGEGDESFDPTYGFTIIDDDDTTKDVVLGMKFCKKQASRQRIMKKFSLEDQRE
ncbi:RNA-directed DNA polymerase, eukaryota [Tanacetum coccineum]